jgi:hypothetical protein
MIYKQIKVLYLAKILNLNKRLWRLCLMTFKSKVIEFYK